MRDLLPARYRERVRSLSPKMGLALGIAAGVVLVLGFVAYFFVQSGWVREFARTRIIAQLERATGGEVRYGSIHFDWRHLRIVVRDLTIRGLEPAASPPLFYVQEVQAGLRVQSISARRIDLASLTLQGPAVHLIVNEDGSTNLPKPKVQQPRRDWLQTIFDLKVARFSLQDGVLLFEGKRRPIEAQGENLQVQFSYVPDTERYEGLLSVNPVEWTLGSRPKTPMSADLTLIVERNRLEVPSATVKMLSSRFEAKASMDSFRTPRLAASFEGTASIPDWCRYFGIRSLRQGVAAVSGAAEYVSPSNYQVLAKVNGRGAAVQYDPFSASGVSFRTTVAMTPGRMRIENVRANGLGGTFEGRAEIQDFETYRVTGTAGGFRIRDVLAAFQPPLPGTPLAESWTGEASGPVTLQGSLRGRPFRAEATIAVAPEEGGVPVNGLIDAVYELPRDAGSPGTVRFGESHLSTGATQIHFSGSPENVLPVRIETSQLDDFLPAVKMAYSEPLTRMPVSLTRGPVRFQGNVTGGWKAPRIDGRITGEGLLYEGNVLDEVSAALVVSEQELAVSRGRVTKGKMTALIDGSLALVNWKPQPGSLARASLTLEGATAQTLASLAGHKTIPVETTVTARATVAGTWSEPLVQGEVETGSGKAWGESFDQFRANLATAEGRVELRNVLLRRGTVSIGARLIFDHPRGDFRNGSLHFEASSNALRVDSLQRIHEANPNLGGAARVAVTGGARLENLGKADASFLLTELNGEARAERLELSGKPVGAVTLLLSTKNGLLEVDLDSQLLENSVNGHGVWKLQAGYPGEFNAEVKTVNVSRLRDFFMKPGTLGEWQFDGSAQLSLKLAGPALEPAQWTGELVIPTLEIFPVSEEEGPRPALKLRNEGPIAFALASSTLTVKSATLVGPGTNLQAGGRWQFRERSPLDFHVNGSLNLAVLDRFTEDLAVTGSVEIGASIRGSVQRPLMDGRLQVKDSAIALEDTTAGLSNLNALVLFNGTQARVQELKAETGGGKLGATGFLDFAGGTLTFRFESNASQVRVRYPEGFSTTADAQLTYSGTLKSSLLSGTVTVLRSSFHPNTDLYSIFAKSNEPVRTPSARSGLLGGLQFDIRVETAPDLRLESALTQDIQAEGNLTVRGSIYNPVVLGRIFVTQGRINFFGTNYDISQGTVSFVNPVRVEPVLNLDLETRVRGIDVILTLAGPINKLSITHRADPPLEFSEVVALLTTGRAPASDPTLAALRASQSQYNQLGATALLGQAIATPVTSRLQRFFGVSRLKIDPNLTGIDNRPQARVTIEQQVTKDITFTYVTDVTRADQQVVQMEWALNKEWSLLAIREENGLFGVDFLYRKSFK